MISRNTHLEVFKHGIQGGMGATSVTQSQQSANWSNTKSTLASHSSSTSTACPNLDIKSCVALLLDVKLLLSCLPFPWSSSWLHAAHCSEVDFVLLQFTLCWLCITEVAPVLPCSSGVKDLEECTLSFCCIYPAIIRDCILRSVFTTLKPCSWPCHKATSPDSRWTSTLLC